MKNIAIIPARSGSKGLKDKNILDICGKPMIWYTIHAAKKSKLFDVVMVSTDSEYYAKVAKDCGAEVPFLRSEEQAKDASGSWDVVREVLSNYDNRNERFDYVALLQPTSPLRTEKDILGAFKFLDSGLAHSVVSVTEVEHPVQWCFKMEANNFINDLADSPYSQCRRQELETYYRENGAIYIVEAKKIMDINYNLYADDCYGFSMPRERSIDIDIEMDYKLAALMIKESISEIK